MNLNSLPSFNVEQPAAVIGVPILASKLRAPLRSERLIRRERIEQSIRSAPAAKLILVRGPAGFGKTTAMSQYYEQLRSGDALAAWLNLDDEDNDFERFLAYLVAIFDRAADAAGVGGRSTMREPATELIYRVAELDRPLAVFMDEFENIKSPAVLDFLRRMIQHLPVGGRLVIGSRNLPELGLGRLRVSHQLLEIGPEQLRFSLDETVELFRLSPHPSPSDADMKLLHHHTEGWAAALHLASLSFSSSESRHHAIASFSGAHADVADYLEEDVFAKLPDELQEFLLKSCVLSELSASLCVAVTGIPHSAELLARLVSMHLFLIPLDAERRRYRYHALFADFLRTRLKRRHPERVAGLHRAASRWYVSEGLPIPAIDHALAGEDLSEALALLEIHAPSFLRHHRLAQLLRWYDALPLSALDSHPWLCIPFAWALAATRRSSEAIRLIDGLSHSSRDSPPDSDIPLSCVAIRVVALVMADQLVACGEACDEAPPALLEKPSFAGGMLTFCRSVCLIAEDRFDKAVLTLAEAQRHYAAVCVSSSVTARTKCETLKGVLHLVQGRLRDAQHIARRAFADWGADPARELIPGAILGVVVAELLYESDELAEAEQLLTEYLPIACEGGPPDIFIIGHIVLARIACAQQDRARALSILSDLEHIGHQQGLPRLVLTHWLERSRIALLEGDMAAAQACCACASNEEAWAPFRSIVPYANDVDLPQIGHLRLLIRKGCHDEALPEIRRQLREAQDRNRHRRGLKLKILLAEALHGSGQIKPAMRVLLEAVQFASGEGFVRTFADEGPTVAQMLLALRQTTLSKADVAADATVLAEFLDRVLRACGHSKEKMAAPSDTAPPMPAGRLTRGEQRVLELLAQGLSNASIAEKLFVTHTTINAHLRNINAKLRVHNRTQAVAVAHGQGFIAYRA